VAQLVPVQTGEVPDAGEVLVFATRVALGLTAIAGEGLAGVARRVFPAVPARAPRPLAFGAGAAVGLVLEMQRRTLAAAGRMAVAAEPVGAAARTRLDPWYRQGVEEQRLNRELADKFWRLLVAQVAAAVIEQVDLDAIVDRIDVDRLLNRIDLDHVAARIDVNAIVARVDMQRVTSQAMDEIEIGQVIRESTSSLADESVEALRVQGMDADRWVSRVVDRLLMRRSQRLTGLDGG
jgi:hypothetical protein